MKVWIGDREEEKGRLLSLGVHPAMIRPEGDIIFSGLPPDSTLREAGLRVPTPKEARYIKSLLEIIGCRSSVWSREGEWYLPLGSGGDDPIYSARLVLIEMED